MIPPGPPVIRDYDDGWPVLAAQLIAELRTTAGFGPEWTVDHIGSTAVPGLHAKPIIDLQLRVSLLPPRGELDEVVARAGYTPEHGARPDSPGVYVDIPRGDEPVPTEVWSKYLYTRGGMPPVVLHVRRADSPWGRYTVWFRDWLRAHDDERDRYAAVKARLAAQHSGDADFDDYTRDKTRFFDQVQPLFERWALDDDR